MSVLFLIPQFRLVTLFRVNELFGKLSNTRKV